MGFLEKLFGKPPPEKTIVLSEKEALAYVENAVVPDIKNLEKTVFSRLAQLKHLLKSLESLSIEMRSKNLSLEEGNFRLRRAVISSKEGLSIRMLSLSKRLFPPQSVDLFEIRSFVMSSKDLVRAEVQNSRKNIAYTKYVLSNEMKAIGRALGEIDQVFTALENDFSKSRLFSISLFRQAVESLENEKAEKKALDYEAAALLEELNNLALKKQRLSLDLREVRESSFAADLMQLEEQKKQLFSEKNALRQKFLSLLSTVDKPLSRFLKLAQADKSILSDSEKELTSHYFQNIFIASKKDPKGESIKKILSRVLDLVTDGTIPLKEKEREKKIAALKELLEYDFFSEIFWKINSLEAEIISVEKRVLDSGVSKKIAALEHDIRAVQSEIDLRQSDHFKLSLRVQQKEKAFSEALTSAQKTAFEACGRQIVLNPDY